MQKKKIICFMGKSGSGKSTIINELHKRYPNTNIVRSFTTREIRKNDANDIHTHTFVSIKEYERNLNEDNIIALYESPKGYKSWTTDKSFEEINLYAIDPKAFIELLNLNKYEVLGIYLDIDEEERIKRLKIRDNINIIDEEKHLDKKILLDNDVPVFIINQNATDRLNKIVGTFIARNF